MYCSKCGQPTNGARFCPNCGNSINNDYSVVNLQSVQNYYQPNNIQPVQEKSMATQIIIGVVISCIIIIATVVILLSKDSNNVYFSDDNNINSNENNIDESSGETSKKDTVPGETSYDYETVYTLSSATTEEAVAQTIVSDSEMQKEGCPKKIIEIENRIVNNYEIDAANLCELDIDFALEIEKIIKFIYEDFPNARDYLSQISLGNITGGSTIAFFQPVNYFTYSDQDSLIGYRTRIVLNSEYYLNLNKFKSSIKYSSASGHFPPNATIYSPLVHEFAHYLSFIAVNNYYNAVPQMIFDITKQDAPYIRAIYDFNSMEHSKRMIEEAYNNYKSKTGATISFDEFRSSISGYAMAKDNMGEYIYDETIAEAFHDVYLNGDNAKPASKEIVAVLKKYVEM